MIFAVSVCVLGSVLFVQGILYLKDLGFSNESSLVSVAIERPLLNKSTDDSDELYLEHDSEEPSFLSDRALDPVELALAESDVEGSAESSDKASLVKGPVLKLPETEPQPRLSVEAKKPRLPALLNPKAEFHQTPGPLMPPLNAEPLQGSRRNSKARQDQVTRSIIKDHLPDASREEREIWFEELQGVPHKVASDLLTIRKLLQPRSVTPRSVLIEPDKKLSQALPGFEVVSPQQPLVALTGPNPDQTGFIGFSSKADRDELMQRLRPTVDALRLSRDVIVNNIANAGTIGFKRSYVEFESLPYDYVKTPASEESETAPPIAVGMGSQVLQTRIIQAEGELIKTGRPLDVAIEGQGFLQIQSGEKTLFTRTGRFILDQEFRLCIRGSQTNYLIEPVIQLSSEAHSIQITESGVVKAVVPDTNQEKEQTMGQLLIAVFADASELFPREACLFEATPRSGVPRIVTPGKKGAGIMQAGYLESSNVSITEELVELASIKQRLDALKTVYMTEPDKPIQADLGLPAEQIAKPGAQQLERSRRPVLK